MLARSVGLAIDEPHGLPVAVDRCALVVDEPGVEADLLHGAEVEIRFEPRGLLGPCDPEAVGRCEGLLQGSEASLELAPPRREEDEDLGARLRAELLAERCLRAHSAAIAASSPSASSAVL